MKTSMPQIQNKFKLFLLAIFCLAVFGGAQAALASTITIGGDHFLTIDGKKQFVVNGMELCSEGIEADNDMLQRINPNLVRLVLA